MGKKTSVWLADDLAERVRASGVPLSRLVERGLEAGGPVPLEALLRRVVREELAAVRGVPAAPQGEQLPAVREDTGCVHPKARVIKGLCGACGENVGVRS